MDDEPRLWKALSLSDLQPARSTFDDLNDEEAYREGIEELVAAERPRGVFSRQLILGDNLDTEKIKADYSAGVLRLQIPVAERAKPRKIEVGSSEPTETKTITA